MPLLLKARANPENNVIPMSLTKLRELTKDSVVFTDLAHTVDLPVTLTIKSELPAPRKGNLGTTKTFINFHKTVTIDAADGSTKKVPMVVKLETSFPVGTNSVERSMMLGQLSSAILQDSERLDAMFYTGILPFEGQYV
jgi:hypothetical protein